MRMPVFHRRCAATELCEPFLQAGLKRASVSAIKTPVGHLLDTEPRLICGLHGGNTSAAIVPDASEWKRAEIWDAHIRAIWEAK